jgi:hypothetical protein
MSVDWMFFENSIIHIIAKVFAAFKQKERLLWNQNN